jgi:hypothetical protein
LGSEDFGVDAEAELSVDAIKGEIHYSSRHLSRCREKIV